MTYHIVFKEKLEDFYAKGYTVKADNPTAAIEMFFTEHRDVVFIALYVLK